MVRLTLSQPRPSRDTLADARSLALQANLSLYTVTALLILDADGNRVLAKYYAPPHDTSGTFAAELGVGAGGPGQAGLQTLKEQRAFEKSVWEKTRRGAGESEWERAARPRGFVCLCRC